LRPRRGDVDVFAHGSCVSYGMGTSLPWFGVKACEGLFRFGISSLGFHLWDFVVPAKAGIHFGFFLRRGGSREPAHVRVGSFDVPVDRSLSFACPNESNPRKGHPRGRGHAGIHARVTARAGSGVCRQYVHVQSANSPPSWRRSLRDFSSACSPRPGGDSGESTARQSLPQRQRRGEWRLIGSSYPRRRGHDASMPRISARDCGLRFLRRRAPCRPLRAALRRGTVLRAVRVVRRRC